MDSLGNKMAEMELTKASMFYILVAVQDLSKV